MQGGRALLVDRVPIRAVHRAVYATWLQQESSPRVVVVSGERDRLAAPARAVDEADEPPVAYYPICAPCVAGEGSECHTPGCALWMRDVPPDGLVVEFVLDLAAVRAEEREWVLAGGCTEQERLALLRNISRLEQVIEAVQSLVKESDSIGLGHAIHVEDLREIVDPEVLATGYRPPDDHAAQPDDEALVEELAEAIRTARVARFNAAFQTGTLEDALARAVLPIIADLIAEAEAEVQAGMTVETRTRPSRRRGHGERVPLVSETRRVTDWQPTP